MKVMNKLRQIHPTLVKDTLECYLVNKNRDDRKGNTSCPNGYWHLETSWKEINEEISIRMSNTRSEWNDMKSNLRRNEIYYIAKDVK